MSKLLAFFKNNLFSILILLLLLLLFGRQNVPFPKFNKSFVSVDTSYELMDKSVSPSTTIGLPVSDESVNTEPQNRLVVEDYTYSLLVKNVSDTFNKIHQDIVGFEGFVVNSYLSKPGEVESGQMVVRVSSQSVDNFKNYLAENSIKVVSFNKNGVDVTDEYFDIEERITVLNQNKQRFTQIMEQASDVDEILKVQRQIFNIQQQIDSLVGRQKYIEQTTSSAKFVIYLSSDEYSLPYNPDTNFRLEVVFKNAVRSLVTSFRLILSAVVWAGVYSVYLFIALAIYLVYKKYRR